MSAIAVTALELVPVLDVRSHSCSPRNKYPGKNAPARWDFISRIEMGPLSERDGYWGVGASRRTGARSVAPTPVSRPSSFQGGTSTARL